MEPITFDDADDLAAELGLTGEPPAKKSEPERPIWEEPAHLLKLPPREAFTGLLKLAGKMDDDYSAFQKARRAEYIAKVEALWYRVKGRRKKFVLSTAETELRAAVEEFLAIGKAAIEGYKAVYRKGVDRLCELLTVVADAIVIPESATPHYLTTVDELSWRTQVASRHYARVRAELYVYDCAQMNVRAEIKINTTGKEPNLLHSYDVWVYCAEDDLTVLRRKSGASLQDMCAEAWARGCNSQVFWPNLPDALHDSAMADGMKRQRERMPQTAEPAAAPEVPVVDLGDDEPEEVPDDTPTPADFDQPHELDLRNPDEEVVTVDGPPRTAAELAVEFDAMTQSSERDMVQLPPGIDEAVAQSGFADMMSTDYDPATDAALTAPAPEVPSEPDPFAQFAPPSDQATTPASDEPGETVPW